MVARGHVQLLWSAVWNVSCLVFVCSGFIIMVLKTIYFHLLNLVCCMEKNACCPLWNRSIFVVWCRFFCSLGDNMAPVSFPEIMSRPLDKYFRPHPSSHCGRRDRHQKGGLIFSSERPTAGCWLMCSVSSHFFTLLKSRPCRGLLTQLLSPGASWLCPAAGIKKKKRGSKVVSSFRANFGRQGSARTFSWSTPAKIRTGKFLRGCFFPTRGGLFPWNWQVNKHWNSTGALGFSPL